MLAGDSKSKDNCRTFVFKGETHTLGNALKNVILLNPQVIFCGYSMPHPAEDQVHQSYKNLDTFRQIYEIVQCYSRHLVNGPSVTGNIQLMDFVSPVTECHSVNGQKVW